MSTQKTIVKITLIGKNDQPALIGWRISAPLTRTVDRPTKEFILILSLDCEIEIT